MSWLNGFIAASSRAIPPIVRKDEASEKISKTADATWKHGQQSGYVLVALCPHCGSRYVRIRTMKGDSVTWWECRECDGDSWKDTRLDHLAPPKMERQARARKL